MKCLFSLVFVLLLLVPLGPAAAAEERFTDHCGSLKQQRGVSYQDFGSSSNTLSSVFNWNDLPDGDGLLTTVAGRHGVAEYQIQNVSYLEVGYYQSQADYATLQADGPMLGGAGEKLPLYWDSAQEQVYCVHGGHHWLLQSDGNRELAFTGCSAPTAKLVPYGLVVSASRDGINFSFLSGVRLPQRERVQQQFLKPVCHYQVQRFQIPEGTKTIRVELFDWRRMGNITNATTPPCLAQVDFYGTGLTIDQAEPSSSSSPSSSTTPSSSSNGSSSDLDLNSRPSSTPSSHHSSSSRTSSSRSGSQKEVFHEEGFLAVWSEGIIISPQPEQSTSHSQPPSQPKPPKKEESVLSPTYEPQAIRGEHPTGPPPSLYAVGGGGIALSLLGILWLLHKR